MSLRYNLLRWVTKGPVRCRVFDGHNARGDGCRRKQWRGRQCGQESLGNG